MKKMMITIAITAALLSLTACSGTESTTANSAAETTTVTEQTTEQTTVQITEPTTELTTSEKPADTTVITTTAASAEQTSTSTKETESPEEAPATTATAAEGNKELSAAAESLIKTYCGIIDGYGTGAPDKYDTKDSVPDREPYLTYFHVTEAPFDSVQGVKDYLAKYLTGKEYDKYIEQIFGDKDHPLYKEVDGKLYCSIMNKGAEIQDVQWDTVRVSDVTENSAVATVTELSYGEMRIDLIFELVKEDGVFKIAEYSWKNAD